MSEFLTGLEILSTCFSSCWVWFVHIFDRAGATSYLLGAIFTFLVYRFFLAPLFGGSGSSDQAKKSGKRNK